MRLTRRRFVLDGLRATLLLPAGVRAANLRREEARSRVLVVLQLTGGNDGLNTVVPHRQAAYARLRPTLAIERGKLHRLDDEHGLHPALGPLRPLVDGGRLTVVHGVGCAVPNRSHFRSLEVWHSGEPTSRPRTGWLGRMADQLGAEAGGMPALCLGEGPTPLALVGRRTSAPMLRDEASLRVVDDLALAPDRGQLLAAPSREEGDLRFLRDSARTAYELSQRLEETLARSRPDDYPDLRLAHQLRLVARLITGGFDTRIFHLSLGGFDTHARQAAAHSALLEELGLGLAAFERDLAAHGASERVLTFVHSEFGRRAAENGSRGTDHGAAAPVFLLGGPGRGGVRGTPPDLERLVEGDVPATLDFRSVYAAIERDWMSLSPSLQVEPLDLAGR